MVGRAAWLLALIVGCGGDSELGGDTNRGAETAVEPESETESEPEPEPEPESETESESETETETETETEVESESESETESETETETESESESESESETETESEVADPCAIPEPALAAPVASDLATLPATTPGHVRGVWFTPSDRPFAPGLHARLDAWLRLANAFFGDELARWTGAARAFSPQLGPDGLWDVVYLRGLHDAAWYAAHPTAGDAPGEALAEIFARLPAEFHRDAVLVYFYDLATQDGVHLANTGQGGSAAPWQGDNAGYVLMGSHVLGFGFDTITLDPNRQHCVFEDTTPSGLEDWDGDQIWRMLDRGEWASTFVGASLHELGHAFGLEHVFDDLDGDGVENNVMGLGLRRFGGRYTPRLPQPPTLLGPTSATALAPHPFLHPRPSP